jgi:excisionase family DNA binding protein
MAAQHHSDERLTLSIEEAGAALGISRSQAYRLVHEGRLPTIKVGVRLRRVPRHALLRLLQDVATAGMEQERGTP